MTPNRSEGPWPRRWLYPLLGVVLAQGAPLGLLLTLRLHMRQWPTWAFITGELQSEVVTYGYLAISTSLVFVICGYLLGRREDQLSARAVTDPLTGLANRRQFDSVLGDHLALAARYRTSLAVMLLDVDRLKLLNDSLGHGAGDAALQQVARCLAQSCRVTDSACRIGGDEFAVVLPGTSREQAQELAERIRATLAAAPPVKALAGRPVTLSIGIADLNTTRTHRADALIAAADRVLLQAKDLGRDRVLVAVSDGGEAATGPAAGRPPAPAAAPRPPVAPTLPPRFAPG